MKQEIEQKIAEVAKNLFNASVEVDLTRPDEQFGDYATNVALQLGNKLSKNPREVAEQLSEKLREELAQNISEVSVAGPGFINLKLTDQSLLESLKTESQKTLEGKTVVTEYSDPNPFKPLHAGHLYTTLVGDTISRLVENAGAKTVRINYGGDVGLHVGKSMWAIIKNLGGELPEKLVEIPEAERPAWLGERYVEGNEAYETNETAKAEIIEMNKKVYQLHELGDHDTPFAQIYWVARAWSYEYFEELYKQLKVKPFDRFIPESEVTPLGIETVKEQLEKGVYKKSNGAVVFEGEPYGLHTRVFINSQGLPTYEAKDVGLMLAKWQDYHYDRSYYITANEQAQYFRVVFKSIEQFLPEAVERAVSMTHGVVKLQGGVKMSSRKGNVVTAMEILDAAHEAAKSSGREVAEETVLAAVKYTFAKARIGGDIIYEPAESIALEGNSGPYLQYAHARARSILSRQSGLDPAIDSEAAQARRESSKNDVAAGDSNSNWIPGQAGDDTGLQPAERALVRKLSEYAETVERATGELMPHHICTYLYELAQTFNSFYEHNRVIGDERQEIRLKLVGHYAETLKNGLELLGITAPDKM